MKTSGILTSFFYTEQLKLRKVYWSFTGILNQMFKETTNFTNQYIFVIGLENTYPHYKNIW